MIHQSTRRVAHLRTCPPACYFHPFGHAASFLTLYLFNLLITTAAAAHAVLLLLVRLGPVFVLFNPFLFIQRCLFKIWLVRQLALRCVYWAVLNCRVPISKISEVVDVLDVK